MLLQGDQLAILRWFKSLHFGMLYSVAAAPLNRNYLMQSLSNCTQDLTSELVTAIKFTSVTANDIYGKHSLC